MSKAPGPSVELGGLNPKQKLFCQARERYVAYGGARGGGKTHVARVKAVGGALKNPGIRILFVRREYPELEQTAILPVRRMVPAAAGRYNGAMRMIQFTNGSVIKFGHFGRGDELEYQGQEWDWIFMDEATQFTEDQFQILSACLRGATPFPRRMYLTCNPGGVGHFWVKRLFVTREYHGSERAEDYAFIPATVYDNPQLLRESPEYLRQLENQPPARRAAWLDGDWDAMSGAFFPEVCRETHMIADLPGIPPYWRRYRSMDYGLDMLACLWIAVDADGRGYVYREAVRPGLVVSEAAALIRAMTPEGEHIQATVAPPDLWSRQKDSGRTMAELFADSGVPLIRAANSRVQGWMALKEYLRPMRGPGSRPGLLFCEGCRRVFSDIRSIQYDEKRVGDCATEPHEVTHTPDALRYFAATRLLAGEAAPDAGEAWDLDAVEGDADLAGGEVDEGYLFY